MAKGLVEQGSLTAIADAIRAKGVEGNWKPAEMAGAIASIQGGGGGSEKFYESAEEAYQDLRPKHWPTMPDATTLLSGDDDTSAGIWIWLIRSPTKSITLSINDNITNSGVIPYIYQNSTWSSLNKYWYWDGETLDLTSYMTLNPTDNMYECVLGLKDSSSSSSSTFFFFNISNFPLSYSTSMKYVVDLDAYYNSTENIDNSNYLNAAFGKVFSGVEFMRLKKSSTSGKIYFSGQQACKFLKVLDCDWQYMGKGNSNSVGFISPMLKYHKQFLDVGTDTFIGSPLYAPLSGRQLEIAHGSNGNNVSFLTGQYGDSHGCKKIVINIPELKIGTMFYKKNIQSIQINGSALLDIKAMNPKTPVTCYAVYIGDSYNAGYFDLDIIHRNVDMLLDAHDAGVISNLPSGHGYIDVYIPDGITDEQAARFSTWPRFTIRYN